MKKSTKKVSKLKNKTQEIKKIKKDNKKIVLSKANKITKLKSKIKKKVVSPGRSKIESLKNVKKAENIKKAKRKKEVNSVKKGEKAKINVKLQGRIKKVAPKDKKSSAKLAAKSIEKGISNKYSSTEISFGPADVQPYLSEEDENYMNENQIEHFRGILLKWKEQLITEVNRTVHQMQDVASNYPDPVDRASQEEEFSLELRARDRERKLLKKIEDALTRINENDYGYCDDCGAEIGVRRLEARPTATQCIECKTIAEIKEKQVGEGN